MKCHLPRLTLGVSFGLGRHDFSAYVNFMQEVKSKPFLFDGPSYLTPTLGHRLALIPNMSAMVGCFLCVFFYKQCSL